MAPTENERRVTALVHTALLAAVGVYAVVLVFFRTGIAPEPQHTRAGLPLFAMFASLGIAQFAGSTLLGRRLLRSARSSAADRVRLYFLLRAAAAEAIAIYGFVLGFLGARVGEIVALFITSVAALLACSPSRAAWEEAARLTERRESGNANR